jgi:hypothetical protein
MTTDKPIPAQMWNEIADARNSAAGIIAGAQDQLRRQTIRVGAKYGFSASELENRGLICGESAARRPGRPQQTDPGLRIRVGRDLRP